MCIHVQALHLLQQRMEGRRLSEEGQRAIVDRETVAGGVDGDGKKGATGGEQTVQLRQSQQHWQIGGRVGVLPPAAQHQSTQLLAGANRLHQRRHCCQWHGVQSSKHQTAEKRRAPPQKCDQPDVVKVFEKFMTKVKKEEEKRKTWALEK